MTMVTQRKRDPEKLFRILLLLLAVVCCGCRKDANQEQAKSKFQTPTGAGAKSDSDSKTQPQKADPPIAPQNRNDQATNKSNVAANEAGNQKIEKVETHISPPIEIQVTPIDAVVSIDRQPLPGSKSGVYLIPAAELEVAEVLITKQGWRSFQTTIKPDGTRIQLVVALGPDPSWWFEQANQAFEKGELLSALSSVAIVEAIEPNHQTAQQLKLQALIGLERPHLAEKQIEKIQRFPAAFNADFKQEKLQIEMLLGKSAMENENYPTAILHLTRAIEMGCSETWIYQQRALANFKTKNLDAAITDARQALKQDASLKQPIESDLASALFQRATVQLEQSNFPAAIHDLNSILEMAPDDHQARMLRASAFNATQQFDAAANDSLQMLKSNPDSLAARLELGFSLTNRKLFAEAIHEFEVILQQDPDHRTALKNRGFCLLKTRRFNDALRDLSNAIELQPDFSDAYLVRGLTLMELNRPEQALADLQRCLELSAQPDVELHFFLAMAHEQLKNFDEAIQQYDAAIAMEPKHLPARLNRCILLTNRGNGDLAIEDASAVLAIEPGNAVALNSRGAAQAVQQNFDEALNDFSAAIENSPDYAEAWFNRGSIRLNQQRYDLAIKDFSQAIEHDSTSIEFYLGRAKGLMQVGEFKSARADLQFILATRPNQAEAIKLLKVLGDDE